MEGRPPRSIWLARRSAICFTLYRANSCFSTQYLTIWVQGCRLFAVDQLLHETQLHLLTAYLEGILAVNLRLNPVVSSEAAPARRRLSASPSAEISPAAVPVPPVGRLSELPDGFRSFRPGAGSLKPGALAVGSSPKQAQASLVRRVISKGR